jgi:hypothetical protein
MTSPDEDALKISPSSADRAIRIGFCVVSLIFSYFATRLSFSIGGFRAIFADMLGGKPLPYLTQLVLQSGTIWVIFSLLFAVLPFVFAFLVPRTSYAIYGIAAITTLQVIQAVFLWTALTSPLFSIISGMTGR